MSELRRILIVLAALAGIVLAIFALAGAGDTVRETAGGVAAVGLSVLLAHL